MVALDAVRAHNSTLKSLKPGLVAVFRMHHELLL